MAKFETQGVLSIVIRYFCQIWIRKFPFILAEEHDQLYISRKFRIFQKSDTFSFSTAISLEFTMISFFSIKQNIAKNIMALSSISWNDLIENIATIFTGTLMPGVCWFRHEFDINIMQNKEKLPSNKSNQSFWD